jgi:Putative adhesin
MSEPTEEPTAEPTGEPTGVVRQQSFEFAGVAEIDISLLSGRVQVQLVEGPGVHVEVRHDPAAGSSWTEGLSSVLSWVSGQFGPDKTAVPGGPEDAVREARVELLGNRLRIESSKALPLRAVPLSVVVTAPVGSHVTSRTGAADVIVTGGAGRLDLNTGTGSVSADRATGEAKVNSGAGTVRLGTMLSGIRAKTGSGDVEVSSVGGNSTLITGTGDVWLGAVQSNVQVRTGSGDLTVADAASGEIHLGTGSGNIRVGIRQGTLARVDLVSTSGNARSDFEVSTEPLGNATLTVTGRTGSGSALVTAATS